MSVGILVITHDNVGGSLLESAHAALACSPLPSKMLSASRDCDPEAVLARAREVVRDLDNGQGVLVLTDLYGATPSNIAARLLDSGRIRIVTGVNLPMLIRVLNYPHLDLDALTRKAVSGGIDGIFQISAGALEQGHTMNRQTVTICNKLGLHARAAAKFVQLASRFESEIKIVRGSREVNGKSIMGVMMLAAGKGTSIDITANGADEMQAAEELIKLVNDRFGEAE